MYMESILQYGSKYHVEVKAQVAGAVIFNDNKQVLLVQELEGSKKGLWHIPSGRIEENEFPQEAATREIQEETGLKLLLHHYLNTYVGCFDDGELVLRHVRIAKYLNDQRISPEFTKEIGKAKFFNEFEVQALYDNNKLRMHQTMLMIKDAFIVIAREA